MSEKPVDLPNMCEKHQALLLQQSGYGPDSPWRAVLIIAQVTLFQMTSTDPKVYERVGGDVHRFHELGCLACLHPDYFGEVVEAAKDPNPGAMKALGERYIANCRIKPA
jgi:hypothetical protein